MRATFRKELNDIIGAINTPQTVKDIRARGFLKIPCERVIMTDRDGKKSNPGKYWLTPEDIPIARQGIKEWESGVCPPLPRENP
jgi:hypothetical protein